MTKKTLDQWMQDLGVESSTPKPTSVGQTKDGPNVSKFIEQWKIKSGLDKVPTYVIFYAYRKLWDGVSEDYKCSKIKFFKTFSKHFKSVRTGKQRYYLLDAEVFDLSRGGLLEARHYDKKHKNLSKAAKERQNKKRKSKVSKPKEESESQG